MNLAKLFTGSNTTVASVVWPLIIGAFIAVLISVINKKNVGKLVKKLLEVKADSPENAISLNDSGLGKNGYLRYATRPTSTLSKMISVTDDKRLYIAEENAFRAETTYVSDKASAVVLIVAAAVFISAGILMNNVVPKLISYATNIF